MISETIAKLKPQNLQEMTNNVGLTRSVRDTTPRFTMSIEQDNQELATLNVIFSAVATIIIRVVEGGRPPPLLLYKIRIQNQNHDQK